MPLNLSRSRLLNFKNQRPGSIGDTGVTGPTGPTGPTGDRGFDGNSSLWQSDGAIGSANTSGHFRLYGGLVPKQMAINGIDINGNNLATWILFMSIGDIITVRSKNDLTRVAYFRIDATFALIAGKYVSANIFLIDSNQFR